MSIKGTWTHYTPEAEVVRREIHSNAWQAIEDLEPGNNLCILTKGQFSLGNLIHACIDKLGPCRVTIATWTANEEQIRLLHDALEAGRITAIRWMVDYSFSRRRTRESAAPLMRELFGDERIRSTSCHAKFAILRGEHASITIRTSMNLNQNPRFEYVDVTYGDRLADFFESVVDEVWGSQPQGLWTEGRPQDTKNQFTLFDAKKAEPSPWGVSLDDPLKTGVEPWP